MKFLKILILCVVVIGPYASFHGDLAQAEDFDSTYPYTKTFTISAYYSPLPCQERYATGSYDGDIRLNGSGVNSADGTSVYPGMVAAPKSYPFGTKMYIPGIGTVAVHDRGGAILASNGVNGVYDRLDIWMGYGDKGLQRALNWGKRNVEVTVYGMDGGIVENITLSGYSPSEAIPNVCGQPVQHTEPVVEEHVDLFPVEESEAILESEAEVIVELSEKLGSDLKRDDSGDEVLMLQEQLMSLNFYKGELNGVYDELTEHAVFKFQQSQYLVGDRMSSGAGIFGPKTRDTMNEIISSKNYTKVLVAEATAESLNKEEAVYIADATVKQLVLKSELDFGMVGPEVRILQEFLREQGYFKGLLITDYYGPVTRDAVLEFQLTNEMISNTEDIGAGRVGPATLDLINSLS